MHLLLALAALVLSLFVISNNTLVVDAVKVAIVGTERHHTDVIICQCNDNKRKRFVDFVLQGEVVGKHKPQLLCAAKIVFDNYLFGFNFCLPADAVMVKVPPGVRFFGVNISTR